MSQTGYTPISNYSSATASAVPLAANLVQGELAINTNDGKLFYKDSSGVVQTMASKATGAIGGSTTQVQFNNSGVLGGSANLTFNGTTLTAAGLAGPLNGTVGATTPAAGTFTALSSTSGALNGTIGATTANTGNFTTLTTSSTITDNGGTANGVTYLNGSKVVTSGSALTFDGTNLGVGTTAPQNKLQVATTTRPQFSVSYNGTTGLYLEDSTNSGWKSWKLSTSFGNGSDLSFVQSTNTSGTPTWATTAAITLDASGNLGVGTASPTSLLQTAGTSAKSAFKTPNIAEVNTVSATAASGTIQYDVTTQSVLYYTSNASANWTVNFRGSSGTSLNTVMQTGESISVTFLATQGATAYYNSAVTIDGNSVTPKWQGGTAPTSGNASSIDSYTYVILKTGSAAFTVLASVTKFA
jgi:hypothetical protein